MFNTIVPAAKILVLVLIVAAMAVISIPGMAWDWTVRQVRGARF